MARGGSNREAPAMVRSADEPPPPLAPRGVTWGAATMGLALTLLVWVLFWQARMPLDLGATSVVALGAALLVAAGQFLFSRIRLVRGQQDGKP